MFNWMYKRIAAGIMRNIDLKTVLTEDTLDSFIEKGVDIALEKVNSEDFMEGITPLTDALYERYKAKVFSTVGGSMARNIARVEGQEVNPLAFIGRSGKINWLGAIQMFLSRKQAQPESGSNPPSSENHNPY